MDSVFHVVEPIADKINERQRAPAGFAGRMGLVSRKTDWFRNYREFFLPSEAYDLVFLKARIAILCSKGFEIMDLME
jgi:RHO1 GDP-GTP exchange protein 1/2